MTDRLATSGTPSRTVHRTRSALNGNDRTAQCVLCGSGVLGPLVPINDGWAMRVCSVCEAGSTWPVPTPEERAEVNRIGYPLPRVVDTYRSRGAEFRGRWDQLLEFLPVFPRSILDVGCSVGFFVRHALSRGVRRAAGVEINERMRSWGASQLGLDIRPSMGSFDGEGFDAVTFQDCLEHIPNPLDALQQAGEMLTDGGVIFVQLPNRVSAMARRAGPRWPWYSAPDHLIHLTPQSITIAASLVGLEVLAVRTCDARVDLIQTYWPDLLPHYVPRLRRLPGFHRLWVRRGDVGGLIQAVLERK